RSGNFVYAPDAQLGGETGYSAGVVRFDLSTGYSDRIVSFLPTIAAAVGKDGKLYTLDDHNELFVYNLDTGAQLGGLPLPYTINGLGAQFEDLAVNAAGDVFATDWNNHRVVEFSPNGTILRSVTLSPPSGYYYPSRPISIDVADDGTLAVGTDG